MSNTKTGLAADLPPAGAARGRTYIAKDTNQVWVSDGVEWIETTGIAAPGAEDAVDVAFSVGAEGATGANTIRVTAQLKNSDGDNLAVVAGGDAWLSTDASGFGPNVYSVDSSAAVAGAVAPVIDYGDVSVFQTDATGKLVLDITDAGSASGYLAVRLRDGSIHVSPIIQFA